MALMRRIGTMAYRSRNRGGSVTAISSWVFANVIFSITASTPRLVLRVAIVLAVFVTAKGQCGWTALSHKEGREGKDREMSAKPSPSKPGAADAGKKSPVKGGGDFTCSKLLQEVCWGSRTRSREGLIFVECFEMLLLGR